VLRLVFEDPQSGDERSVTVGAERPRVTVGRSPDNEIQIDRPSVSRRHAEIVFDGETGCTVRDLDSSNGTYVNGDPVQGDVLTGGEDLRFGDFAMGVERTVDSGSVPEPPGLEGGDGPPNPPKSDEGSGLLGEMDDGSETDSEEGVMIGDDMIVDEEDRDATREFSPAAKRRIEELEERVATLEADRAKKKEIFDELESDLRSLVAQKKEMSERIEALESELRARESDVDELVERLDDDSHLADLQSERDRLAERVDQLETAIREKPPADDGTLVSELRGRIERLEDELEDRNRALEDLIEERDRLADSAEA